MKEQSSVTGQVLDVPKGGGAIRGIGEKFAPDLFTGTGKHAVPIELPAGRSGFQPQLSLEYSSGRGNGYFGLGWSLSVPGLRRRTSHGVPVYEDRRDVFVLSGAEDLVPVAAAGTRVRFRPRTEGLLARIERVLDPIAMDDYWRVQTPDGIVNIYGTPGRDGLTDPAAIAKDPGHKFAWMLTQTIDLFGNRIEYVYDRDTTDAAEIANGHSSSQPLLQQVRYAETVDATGAERFLITVTFEYEPRSDQFSDCRAGFEIRTRQRCSGILVETHFDRSRKVRRYALRYQEDRFSGLSLLTEVELIGYDDGGQGQREMPPLAFSWTEFDPLRAARRGGLVPVTGIDQPDTSLAAPNCELVDLSGDGLPDVIRMDGVARYWRNLGAARLDRMRIMGEAPPLALATPGVRLLDADGDARTDLFVAAPTGAGFFALNFSGEWDIRSYRRQTAAPGFALDDPQVRLLDLDGDGITDVLRTGSRLETWINDPAAGWKLAAMTPRRSSAEFPDVFFSDQRVQLGDMNGDGLQDIVMINSGRIDYWPNLGHGSWGRRVTMRRAPQLPPDYDPRRLLVGDVDGDGAADLLYIENDCVRLWINRSGNEWSDQITIHGTPPVSDMGSVRLTDFLGQGLSGILWSRDAGPTVDDRMLFLDLSGGVMPRLLCGVDNQMGAVTRIEYTPSTRFYLEDEEGPLTRWKTHLPFPVHVVARVEVIDEVGQSRLCTRYCYHHGYWDGVEREFRGFGLVEQYDTETFDQWHDRGITAAMDFRPPARRKFFSPPTLTKIWFHLGAVGTDPGEWTTLDFSADYSTVDASLLSVLPLPTGLSHAAGRDAARALRGRILRTELYAVDSSAREALPFTVTEAQHEVVKLDIEMLAPGTSREPFAVFSVREVGQRNTQWERGNDPRTTFTFRGDFDAYGRPHVETEIACPRGWRAMSDHPPAPFLARRTRHDFATRDDAAGYVVDRAVRTAVYEMKNDGQVLVTDLRDAPDPPVADLIQHTLMFYDGAAFSGLPFGQLGAHAALVRTEELALTESLLTSAFVSVPVYLHVSPNWQSAPEYPAEFRSGIPARAGYVFSDGGDGAHVKGWYVVTHARCLDTQRPPATGQPRGLTVAQRDSLGHETLVDYASELLPSAITTPNGLTTSVEYDLRVLRPRVVSGPNGERRIFSWTALGLVGGVRQQGSNNAGDQRRDSMSFTYGFQSFRTGRQQGRIAPVFAHKILHTEHDTSSDPDTTIESRDYSDGYGRVVQTRTQAADVIFGALPFADDVLPSDQSRVQDTLRPFSGTQESAAIPFAAVSGWQTFDNKGHIVEKFEPLFATDWDYAPPGPSVLRAKTTYFYDPLGRPVRVLHPDGSEERNVHGVPQRLDQPDNFSPTPWEAFTWDANDNAGRTHAARATAFRTHWNTPSSSLIDPLGRIIRSTMRKGLAPSDEVVTTSRYDLRGNLTTTTDALNRPSLRNVYDLLNRRLRLDSIDAGARTTLTDAAGNEIEARDGRGALVLRLYDETNRPIRRWARDDDAEPITLREKLIYGDDPQGGLSRAQASAANLLGRLYRHFDEAGVLTCELYDFKGNCIRKTRQVISDTAILAGFDPAAPGAFRVDWNTAPALDPAVHELDGTYDALNRPKSLVYPKAVDGTRRTMRAAYDQSGALESIRLDAQTVIERLAYDARGQRVLVLWGNGLLTRYAYEPTTSRLQRRRTEGVVVTGLTLTPQGNPLEDAAQDYDLAGNILAVHHREKACGFSADPDKLDRLFTYDPLYRLETATGRESDTPPLNQPWDDTLRPADPTRVRGYTERYAYDDAGNLLSLQHSAGGSGDFRRDMDLEPGSNRLVRIRGGGVPLPIHYDASGNQTGEGESRTFEWDHRDRLRAFFVQATPGRAVSLSLFTHYLYDSAGNRVKKLTRNQQGETFATTYIGPFFEHHRERVAENNALHVTDGAHRLATIRVGTPFSDDSTPAVKFTHADHLDSCVLTTDAAGQLVSREEYTPWGDTSYGSFTRKRYRFSGKERDSETGLYYYGARYYAPGLARWVSCDPAGGINLYSAFADNPVCFTDSSGEQVEPPPAQPAQVPAAANASAPTLRGPTSSADVFDQVSRDACLKYGCFRSSNPVDVKTGRFLEGSALGFEYQELLRRFEKAAPWELEIPQSETKSDIEAIYADARAYILATEDNPAASTTPPVPPGGSGVGHPSVPAPAEEATPPAGASTALVVRDPASLQSSPTSGPPAVAPGETPNQGEGWWGRFTRSARARVIATILGAVAPKDVDNPDPGQIKPRAPLVEEERKKEERREQAEKVRRPTLVPPPPPPKPRMQFNLLRLQLRQEQEALRTGLKEAP